MTRALLNSLAALSILAAPVASAQDYPTKGPIKLVIGFAAGGGTDAIARSLNTRMGEILKQSVLVENRPSAGGIVATEAVAKSAADGYTVSFNVNTHAINQALYPKLPYDTERDLRGVTLIGSLGQTLAAHPAAEANTLQQFLKLEAADSNKKRLVANGGVGSPGHLAAAYLESLAAVKFTHVPYRGAGPGIIDVIGGQVPVLFDNLPSSKAQIDAGKMRLLAVASAKRLPAYPNVPTFAEIGMPEVNDPAWYGLVAPAKTPKEIIDKLYAASVKAVNAPAIKEKLSQQGADPVANTPAEFARDIKNEYDKMKAIVVKKGIKLD